MACGRERLRGRLPRRGRHQELLDGLQRAVAHRKGEQRPKAVFGRLHDWLAHETEDEAYDPLREIIARHFAETMPVWPGERIFGRPVPERRVHSVHSAAREYGLHRKRLRKLLHAKGIIGDEAMALSDDRAVFPAAAADAFLSRPATSLSMREAEEHLNAPRPAGKLLVEAGFLVPIVEGGNKRFGSHAFAREDLDTFLSRLLTDADDPAEGMVNILGAAKRATCSTMEVVRLLLERRLSRVGRDAGSRGYLSVLVDPDEVRGLVRGEDHGGLSLREVEKRMSWSTAVLKALVDDGLLPSRMAVNPVNRCPQRVVDPQDLESFDARFVSLQSLGKERGIHFRRLTPSSARRDPSGPALRVGAGHLLRPRRPGGIGPARLAPPLIRKDS